MTIRTIFDKTYDGFEDIYDLGRDVHEAFDPRFNPKAAGIPGEFQGKIRVTITYEPDVDDLQADST